MIEYKVGFFFLWSCFLEASNIPFPCNSKPHLVCFVGNGKDLTNNNMARVVSNVNGSNYMADLAWLVPLLPIFEILAAIFTYTCCKKIDGWLISFTSPLSAKISYFLRNGPLQHKYFYLFWVVPLCLWLCPSM